MTKNSHFISAHSEADAAVGLLVRALNEQHTGGGIVRAKIVLVIEALLAGQMELGQETREQLAKFVSGTHPESVCFQQKVDLIVNGLQSEQVQTTVPKYSGLLAANTYTEKRAVKIKELDFAKKLAAMSKAQQKATDVLDQTSESAIIPREPVEETGTPSRNCTNLIDCDALKKKIQKKKQSKADAEEETSKPSTDVANDGQNTGKSETGSLSLGKNGVEAERCCPRSGAAGNYYIRYLILF